MSLKGWLRYKRFHNHKKKIKPVWWDWLLQSGILSMMIVVMLASVPTFLDLMEQVMQLSQ